MAEEIIIKGSENNPTTSPMNLVDMVPAPELEQAEE